MPTVSAEVKVFIRAEVTTAFDFFCDLRNEPAYNAEVSDVRKSTEGEIGPGTCFEGRHVGLGAVTWRLAEYQRPTHVAIDGRAGASAYRWVGDFEPATGGTTMRGRMEVEPGGLLRALGPLLRPLLGLSARRAFGGFVRAVEAR